MSNLVPVDQIQTMATAVAKSGLFGVKTTEQAMALMLIAQAEGMHPAIAARDYHVIQGRPALKADAMLARFQSAGGKVDWKTYTDEEVTGVFSHPQGGSVTVCWTMAQARSIGLGGKENWRNYPRAMLRARCISEGIRTVYPGCVVGVYTPEEVQDFDAKPPVEKDMGDVEVVTMKIPLAIPGTEKPYKHCSNEADFIDSFAKIIKKLADTNKLSADEKSSRYAALYDINKGVIEEHQITAEIQQIILDVTEVENG